MLQLLARKEDAAFHRSKRKAETFGNLAVLETGHVHGERNFIVAWKGVDDTVHFFQVAGTFGTGKTGILGHAEVILVVRLILQKSVPELFYDNY